ncbi:hypothetical protein PH12_12650 [Salmonella enterica subsp. enterica serovar Newport]|nr:hypothetical protein [Salmonella enterica subsp. enterica serovar Newport]
MCLLKHSSALRCEEINMNLKLQLKILSFLQFCLWGSWLTTRICSSP